MSDTSMRFAEGVMPDGRPLKLVVNAETTVDRDTFALAALSGLLRWHTPTEVAPIAYRIADAMLAERAKTPE